MLHTYIQSALYICKNPMYHEKTKYIDVRFHFIRDEIEKKKNLVKKILGDVNYADFDTKIVLANKFIFCRNSLKNFEVLG